MNKFDNNNNDYDEEDFGNEPGGMFEIREFVDENGNFKSRDVVNLEQEMGALSSMFDKLPNQDTNNVNKSKEETKRDEALKVLTEKFKNLAKFTNESDDKTSIVDEEVQFIRDLERLSRQSNKKNDYNNVEKLMNSDLELDFLDRLENDENVEQAEYQAKMRIKMKEKELQIKSINKASISSPSSSQSNRGGWKKGFFNIEKKLIKKIEEDDLVQPKININPPSPPQIDPIIEPVTKDVNPVKILKPVSSIVKEKNPIEKEIEANPLNGSRFRRDIKNRSNDENMKQMPIRPIAFSGNIVERGFP